MLCGIVSVTSACFLSHRWPEITSELQLGHSGGAETMTSTPALVCNSPATLWTPSFSLICRTSPFHCTRLGLSMTPHLPVYRTLKDHISIHTHSLQSSEKIQLLRQDCERLKLRPQGSRDNPTVIRAGQALGSGGCSLPCCHTQHHLLKPTIGWASPQWRCTRLERTWLGLA